MVETIPPAQMDATAPEEEKKVKQPKKLKVSNRKYSLTWSNNPYRKSLLRT